MTGHRRWVAGIVGAMLGVLLVGVLLGARSLHATHAQPAGTHVSLQGLPPGVCPLSTEGWPTGLTRIEAKLVTYGSLFGSPRLDTATSARTTQPTTPPPPYYWVIAGTGNYDLGPITRPAIGAAGPAIVHSLWIYVRADQCAPGSPIGFSSPTYAMVDGWPVAGLTAGGYGWPAFFDHLPAVVYVRIR